MKKISSEKILEISVYIFESIRLLETALKLMDSLEEKE